MNRILVAAILSVACLGLIVALVVIKTRERQELATNTGTIVSLSNDLSSAQEQITGLNQVNEVLSNNLAASQETTTTLSNQLGDVQGRLTEAQAGIVRAEQQITNLNGQIVTLQTHNKELEQRAVDLTSQMADLDKQIAVTEAALSQSKTNNAFLERELKKQVNDREMLERKFTDLNQVRAQYKKLKTDAFIATRLRWMHEGTDPSQQVKGGQLLGQHQPLSQKRGTVAPNGLNVEVESGGGVRVISNTATNAP